MSASVDDRQGTHPPRPHRPEDARDAHAQQSPGDAHAARREAARRSIAATLATEYPGLIAAIVRRAGGDRQRALDVLQDAIVTALTKLDAGAAHLDVRAIAGFVVRTAFNHLRNQHRRERQVVPGDALLEHMHDETHEALLAASEERDSRALVRAALEGIPSLRDREAVVRFYLHEQERAQVCEGLGLTAAQFDRIVSRARERMRALLQRSGVTRWDVLGALIVLLAL